MVEGEIVYTVTNPNNRENVRYTIMNIFTTWKPVLHGVNQNMVQASRINNLLTLTSNKLSYRQARAHNLSPQLELEIKGKIHLKKSS